MAALKISASFKTCRTAAAGIISFISERPLTTVPKPSWVNGSTRNYQTSSRRLDEFITNRSAKDSIVIPYLAGFKKLFGRPARSMGYFVIGVSGVTCGGKTSLTKLIQRTFPWARVIHQDHYFHDDDWPHHIMCPEAENHVNYEIFQSLNMPKMYEDVRTILSSPAIFENRSNKKSAGIGEKADTPNYDEAFLQQIPYINFDVAKYNTIPILIIEGFTIFASQYLFEKCDVRFFCSLEKEPCQTRRALRKYFPPDSPSYFEKIVWPEYTKHFEEFVNQRSGITVFDGCTPMDNIWTDAVQIVACRMEEKCDESLNYKTENSVFHDGKPEGV